MNIPPPDEMQRLKALRNSRMLDTPPETAFDEITRLAAQICGTPIAMISLVDESRQWFKSKIGIDATETPREHAFCAHVLKGTDLLLVPDALLDSRFAENPLVQGDPKIRFYAGAPLATPEGHNLGTLCVIDRVPRQLTDEQIFALRVLRDQVMTRIRLRRELEELARLESEQRRLAESLTTAQSVGQVGSWETDLATREVTWSTQIHRIFGTDPETFRPTHAAFLERVHPDERDRVDAAFTSSLDQFAPASIQHRILLPDGQVREVEERWQSFPDSTGKPARAIGTCQDITERRLAERQLQLRAREQAAVAKLGLEAMRAKSLGEFFETATRTVAETLEVELCKVLQLTPDNRLLRLVSGVGWQPGLVGTATVGTDAESQAGFTLCSDGPIFVNDLSKETRFTAPPLLTLHGVSSGTSVTIHLQGRPWGVLGAHSRSVRNFTAEDARFMQSVAALISVVIERLAVQEALGESDRKMKAAQRIAHLGSWELDLAGNQLTWSDEVFRIFGVDPADFRVSYASFMERIHPEDRARMQAAQDVALAGEGVLEIDHRILLPNGHVRHVRERGELVRNEAGKPVSLSGTVLDITERSRLERMRIRENRVLESVSAARPLPETLEKIALGVEDVITGSMSSILLLEGDRLRNGAAPNLPAAFSDAIDGIAVGPTVGSCGTAAHRGQVVVVVDIATDPLWVDYRDLALEHGLRACWSHPVLDDTERVIATFAVYHREPRVPQPEDMDFIRRWVHLAGIAIMREQRRKQLQESEERFRRTFANAATGIAITDPEGRFLESNTAFCRMVGYTENQLRAMDFWSITHPEDMEASARFRRELQEGRIESYVIEKRYLRSDGGAVWSRVSVSALRDAAGQPHTFVGVAEDITERKKAEETLRASEAAQREAAETQTAILNAIPAHIALVDRNGVIVAVNESWRRFASASALNAGEFFIGTNYIDLCETAIGDCAHEAAAVARSLRDVLAGKVQGFELEYPRHSPEEPRWFRLMVTPLREDGQAGAVVMHVNVTDRKLAEEKLREQAALLDRAQDAILVRDLHHRIVYWNHGAERLYGWSAEEALDRSAEELLHRDPTAFRAAMAATLEKGEWIGELAPRSKNDSQLAVECRWTLVRDAAGQARSILEIATDVTERRKLEAQFMRAQRMESIGTLAGGIAHDLNNMLAPILMSIELLKMGADEAERAEILQTIESSARRGADMVGQVLSFARGVEGRKVEVQLPLLLRDIQRIVRDTFPKNIETRVVVPEDLWTLIGDPTQIHQVLLNLCVNARDAMPNGGALTISAKNKRLDAHYAAMTDMANPGPHIMIDVADTGTGIPPELIERIFDPFFTTKETGRGTGLGLSTSLAIVKSHGGFVRVYSEPDKGSRFRIYLPASTERRADSVAPDLDLPRGRGELVLVVDDEASIRQITRQTLEAFGYRVLLATDGADAVAVYAAHKDEISLVLTDMMMPVMDGPSTIKVLMKMNPKVLIVAASGLNANGHAAKAASSGVKHFLPKPYTAETLLRTFRDVLRSTAQKPGPARPLDP